MTDVSLPLPAQQRREWLLIGLLLLIMLLKGVLWSVSFPLWQGPDEDDHYAVIQFIAETGRLPDEADVYLPDEVALSRALADVGRLPYAPEQRQAFSQTAVGPNEPAFAELSPTLRATVEMQAVGKLMHATPLYYVLGAAVYRLFDEGDLLARAHIQRLLTVLIGAPLVVVAYLIARILFPADPALRLTIPTLVAFQPMITEITAVISVDGLLILCYSLLIYLSLRLLRDGLTPRLGLVIGVVFAVGMLTKPTLSGFAPPLALLVAYDWWRGRERRREVVLGALLMGLVAAVPVGWWMQRSYRLNGDLFYFNPVVEGHRIIERPFYDYAPLQHMADYYQSVWGGIFTTWWAHFGWLDTALPPWVYYLLRGLTVLAVIGLLYRLAQLRRRPLHSDRWANGEGAAPPVVWLFLALTVLIPIVLLQFYDLTFWWEYGNGRGLQGRYWLGTAVPMLTFFTLGLLCLTPPRWHTAAHTLLRAGMALLNFASLLGYILPRYYL
jgi:4-amino-4-deoxy-L-arabinose transferase-like glycosyltransferase